METDSDGFARAARIEKARPTQLEDHQFRSVVILMAVVLLSVFGLGIIGSAMMFWRLLG
jgi:hypothetical protein